MRAQPGSLGKESGRMTVLRIIFLGDGCERVSGATFAFPGPQRSSRNEREGSTGANLV